MRSKMLGTAGFGAGVDGKNTGWLDFSYMSDDQFAAFQKANAAHRSPER